MDKIAVLIPCYNESATIEKVVLDWKKELPEGAFFYGCRIVNAGENLGYYIAEKMRGIM